MLTINYQNDIAIIHIKNERKFTFFIADKVKEELHELINQNATKIIFNLDGIVFIDSTGFAALISTLNLAKEKDCIFKICNISSGVMELIEVTKLDSIFDIYSSVEECIKSLE